MNSKKENEFYVATLFFIVITTLMVVSVGFGTIAVADMVKENGGKINSIIFIGIVMLFIVPISLFLWSLFTMTCKITIDETGVTRRLFGIRQRFIAWEEVKEVRLKNFVWLFISKKHLGNWNLSRCRLSKDTIYLIFGKKVVACLKKYCPRKDLLEYL